MRARDIMRQPVVTTSLEATAREVALLMRDRGHAGLPVVDEEGRVVGMVTETDLLHLALPRWLEGVGDLSFLPENAGPYLEAFREVADRPLREFLGERPVPVAEEEDSLLEVIRLMTQHRVRRIPVVRESRLTGIITREDVMAALFDPSFGNREEK